MQLPITRSAALALALIITTVVSVSSLSAQAQVTAQDSIAPGSPVDAGAFPATQTAADLFTIFWTNPVDPDGVVAAWYRFDTAPTSAMDGTRVIPTIDPADASKRLIESLSTGGRTTRTMYLWLEDGAGNVDHATAITLLLYPEGALDELVRVAGADRFVTSAATSQKIFPEDQSASAVVLANGLGFADALAGVPLAFAANAPILLTRANQIPQAVWDELQRVLPTGTVYLLGGTAAIDTNQEDFLRSQGYDVRRLSGKNRMETSVAILRELDILRGTAVTSLYLVNGFTFPDALSISALAAVQQRGIMLTESNDLTQVDRDYINDNAATISTVTIIGGTAVVPSSVAKLLSDAGYAVSRIGGNNRYHTSRLIADLFVSGGLPAGVAVASGENFADALPAGVHAGAQLFPLTLVPTSQGALRCSDTYDFFRDNHIDLQGGYLYGGNAALAAGIESDIEAALSGGAFACGG